MAQYPSAPDGFFRAQRDLAALINREPPLEENIKTACIKALRHVNATIGYLDGAPPWNHQAPIQVVQREIPEGRSVNMAANADYDWMYNAKPNQGSPLRVLRLIRDDLNTEMPNDFSREQIDQALFYICELIGSMIPKSE